MKKKPKLQNTSLEMVAPNEEVAFRELWDTPDFTPEQWAWLKAHSAQYEKDFVPTRSLLEDL